MVPTVGLGRDILQYLSSSGLLCQGEDCGTWESRTLKIG